MKLQPTGVDYYAVLPEISTAAGACVLLLVRAASKRASDNARAWITFGIGSVFSAGAILAALAAGTRFAGKNLAPAFSAVVARDMYAVVAKGLIGLLAIVSLAVGCAGLRHDRALREEYGALVLLASTGMMAMVGSLDLVTMFLGLELFSLAFYVLTAFLRERPAPREAALKYFLLGSFASAFFLYGVMLIYGAVGSTNLTVAAAVADRGGFPWLLLAGTSLVLVGLGFKVGAVPFHMWVPDVYQGSPSYLSGVLAAGAKVGGFGAAVRIFASLMPARSHWIGPVAVVGVATMAVGAAGAIGQSNVKRILAYSSIVHAGYLFLAIGAPTKLGVQAALFYLASYALLVIGAFAVVSVFQRNRTDCGTLEDFRGIARERPVLGLAFAVLLLGLAGIPPTSGFFAKLLVFEAALEQGLVLFAVCGAVASVIAAYFYIRLLLTIYATPADSTDPEIDRRAKVQPALAAGIAFAVAATAVLGVFPEILLSIASKASF
jgi:NADH-quinone oxidoreductase subunit N